MDFETSYNEDEVDSNESGKDPFHDEEEYKGHTGVDANRSLEDDEICTCEDFD